MAPDFEWKCVKDNEAHRDADDRQGIAIIKQQLNSDGGHWKKKTKAKYEHLRVGINFPH